MAEQVVPVKITGDERDFVGAARRAGREGRRAMGGIGTAAKSLGGPLGGLRSQVVGVGTAFAAAFGAKELIGGAIDLEQATVKLRTQLGLTAAEAQQVESQAKGLAETYGVAADASVNAGFAIQSAGLRGASAAEALEAATKGAAIGLGEARDIGLLSAAAMTAWGEENLSATRSTEILGAAVKAGNLEASELAGALGQALAPASTLGIEFEELAGSVAFYTRFGVGASEATSAVRGAMTQMLKPSSQAQKVLADIGMTTADLQKMVGEQGLVATLQHLRTELGDDQEAFARVIGRAEALSFALAVTGEGGEDMAAIMDDMANSSGSLDEAWKIQSETAGTQLKASWETLMNIGTDLAAEVLPAIVDGLKFVASAAKTLFSALESQASKDARDNIADIADIMERLDGLVQGDPSFGAGVAELAANFDELNKELDGTGGLLGTFIGAVEWLFPLLGNVGTTVGEAEHNTRAYNATVAAAVVLAEREGIAVGNSTESKRDARDALIALLGSTELADAALTAMLQTHYANAEAAAKDREETVKLWHARKDTRDITIAMAQGNIFAATTTGDLATAQREARDDADDLTTSTSLAEQAVEDFRTAAEAEIASDPFDALNRSLGIVTTSAFRAQASIIAVGAAVQIAELMAVGGMDAFAFIDEIHRQAVSQIRALQGSVGSGVQGIADQIMRDAGVEDFITSTSSGGTGGTRGGGTSRTGSTTTPTGDDLLDPDAPTDLQQQGRQWLAARRPDLDWGTINQIVSESFRTLEQNREIGRGPQDLNSIITAALAAYDGPSSFDGDPKPGTIGGDLIDSVSNLHELPSGVEALRNLKLINERGNESQRSYFQMMLDTMGEDGYTQEEIKTLLDQSGPIVKAIEQLNADEATRAKEMAKLQIRSLKEGGIPLYNALVDAGLIEGDRLSLPEPEPDRPHSFFSSVQTDAQGRVVRDVHGRVQYNRRGFFNPDDNRWVEVGNATGLDQATLSTDEARALTKIFRGIEDGVKQTATNTATGRRTGLLT